VIRMMVILGLMSLALAAMSSASETATEIGVGTGCTENLFNDSTAVKDSYVSPYINFNLYPSSSIELSLSGAYTAYREVSDLSYTAARGGVTFVSVSENRPLSIYLSSAVSLRRYGDLYSDYNFMQANASASVRYRLAGNIHLRTGGVFSSSVYSNLETGDNVGYGVFSGINLNFPGSNTLDIEGGLDITSFTGLASSEARGWRHSVPDNEPDSSLADQLQTAYFSLRFSRPLGKYTGINIEYAARFFAGGNEVATYGLTLNNLSPWTAFWEGQAVSSEIKSFIIPNMILTAGASFRKAEYMDALEKDATSEEEIYYLQSRRDERWQSYLGIQRPFVISPGRILSPSINISYVDNQSTHLYYDYSSMSLSFIINLQF